MQRTIILLAACLLLNRFQSLDAKLNVIPRDTEVMVNYSTYMNCSTSFEAEKVHWRHGNNYVYAGSSILEPYDVRFSVEINASTGTSNLVIRSVQPSDAGQYECLEDEGFGAQRSAQLIVLDDDPVCKSDMHSRRFIGPNDCNIEPDEIILSCSITYHSNVYPILQWKANGGNQSIAEGLYKITSNKNEVTYTLAMNSTLDLHNSSFICQTTRTSERNYSCSSDVIKILYAIGSKVAINMTINDEVTCFANTSQSCSYKWKWFNGYDWIDLSNGQILKPNEVGRYRCEATCSINNKSCTVESMFAEVYSIPATSERNLMALLVLIVLPVIALIGVVIYFWKRRQALPEKCKSDPVLVQTIKTEVKTQITGLAMLDAELFVVSLKSSEVEVYNWANCSLSRQWNLEELIDPRDIGSCNRNKCLYILDIKRESKSHEILRVDRNGKLIRKWSTGEWSFWGHGLSVTDESNIISIVYATNNEYKLNEYSPDGQLVSEINLSDAQIMFPYHAIKLANGHFLVTHSGDLASVCVVDADGNLKKSFDGNCGSTIERLDGPSYLAVDGNGFVMVVDGNNDRVLLLDLELKFKRVLLSRKKFRVRYDLWKILLDQANNRLLMSDENEILIFSLPRENKYESGLFNVLEYHSLMLDMSAGNI